VSGSTATQSRSVQLAGDNGGRGNVGGLGMTVQAGQQCARTFGEIVGAVTDSGVTARQHGDKIKGTE